MSDRREAQRRGRWNPRSNDEPLNPMQDRMRAQQSICSVQIAGETSVQIAGDTSHSFQTWSHVQDVLVIELEACPMHYSFLLES